MVMTSTTVWPNLMEEGNELRLRRRSQPGRRRRLLVDGGDRLRVDGEGAESEDGEGYGAHCWRVS